MAAEPAQAKLGRAGPAWPGTGRPVLGLAGLWLGRARPGWAGLGRADPGRPVQGARRWSSTLSTLLDVGSSTFDVARRSTFEAGLSSTLGVGLDTRRWPGGLARHSTLGRELDTRHSTPNLALFIVFG